MAFLIVHKFTNIGFEIDLTSKVSPKCMPAKMQTVWDSNLRTFMFGLILKKKTVSGKTYYLTKMAYGLRQDISCIKFLVVSDSDALFK